MCKAGPSALQQFGLFLPHVTREDPEWRTQGPRRGGRALRSCAFARVAVPAGSAMHIVMQRSWLLCSARGFFRGVFLCVGAWGSDSWAQISHE